MTSTPVRGETAVAAPDPTPLLSARLSALPVPHDSDHLYHSHRLHEHYHDHLQSGFEPDSEVQHDVNHRPPASPTLSSSSMLISSALSQPEALSRAIHFSRLRLLLPLFSHWSARTAAIRAREEDLVAKRGDWLRRCALEQWHGRRARIWEKEEEATRWCAGKTQRRAIATWRDKVAERARRHRVDGLTGARDRVVARRNARILETAVRAWRLAAAERVVQRRRAGRIALGALTAWAERSRSRAERERSLEQLAEERFDRSELRRAKIAWKWWISRTALRVKEDAIRTEKNRQVVEGAWEAWRNKALEKDRIRRLEALAVYSDSHRLATESLAHWVGQLVRQHQQAKTARQHANGLLAKRASTFLQHWRLAVRLRLSTRVHSSDIVALSLDRWLDKLEHVQFTLANKADAHLAARDAVLGRVSFSSWRTSTARVARLTEVAGGVHRTRVLVKALGTWRGRHASLAVQDRKAEVVRDFMLLRGCWRKWSEKDWERRKAAWESQKRRERVREAWQFWVSQTQRKRLERELVCRFRRKQDRRFLAGTVDIWVGAVIRHREWEHEAAEWSDGRVLRDGFAGWAEATVRAHERLVLADAHRSVKHEELRERTLTAIEHHKVQLASRALACWRAWTPGRDMSLQAAETDRRAMQSGTLQVWRIKTNAKFALRSISGRMRIGHSPSSVSPPLRVSTAQPSQSSDASPSPSFVTLSTPSRSAFASTAATSLPRASPAPGPRAGTHPTAGTLEAPPAMARRYSGSSDSSVTGRPRLSAEYAHTGPAEIAARPRRRKSIISLLGGARSDTAGGRRGSFDVESEDELRNGGGETRSEGGRRDVRSQHDALRRRLREAAAKATHP
ncbi:hypothetical protein JCM8202v2_003141 [Rhodotorula sphaerocarpa]